MRALFSPSVSCPDKAVIFWTCSQCSRQRDNASFCSPAVMNITTTASTWVLRAAMVALYATMTAGVFLAVQGLISLYTKLTEKSDEAAEAEEAQKQASDEASQAQQRESSQLKETRAALEINIQKLKDFHDHNFSIICGNHHHNFCGKISTAERILTIE